MAGFLFLFVVGAALTLTPVAAGQTCLPSNSSEIRVTFDSHKNKTGRWTHEIGLEHEGLPSSSLQDRKPMPWTVDVKYVPKSCDERQKHSIKVLISFPAPESVHAADYVFLPGLGNYKYYSTLVTWDVAKTTCEQDGAHLAILNSQQEADALKKMIVNTSVDWAWLGLTKKDPKGEFVTLFGDLVSTTGYNLWYSGHSPANAVANSAALIHKSAGTMAYNTTPTATKFVFLCEQY